MAEIEVKVGQVWIDNDARSQGRRTLRVESIGPGPYATVVVLTGWDGSPPRPGTPRRTRIRLDRFKPTSTGYRLRDEAPHRCPNCAPGYDCESGVYVPEAVEVQKP